MYVLQALLIISSAFYVLLAPSENYPHSASLDSNFMLYWKYNDTHITFETQVNADGYTGFGISANGSMFPGDVVIGYVDGNQQVLQVSSGLKYISREAYMFSRDAI